MIAIMVKWPVKAEHADSWPELSQEFTRSARGEEGNLWFEWSRSLEEPNTYVLLEAYTDQGAEEHVSSEHFAKAMKTLGKYTAARPRIVSLHSSEDGWNELGELEME